MAQVARSIRQEQRELSAKLRAEKNSWVEIAKAFAGRYGMNARVALRTVRDWSQRDAAEAWNARWPDDPKTDKNFSYWELWPGVTGYAPSLDVLGKLAELYECSIADLVSDCADFRAKDAIVNDDRQLIQVSEVVESGLKGEKGEAIRNLRDLVYRLEHMEVQELTRASIAWFDRLGMSGSRRALLLKLSASLSLAAASSALADENDGAASAPAATSPNDGFEGIWYSRYVYPSTGRGGDFVGQHYVVMRQQGNRLVAQSLPNTTGSNLRMELAVDSLVATGTWREVTSPTGYYKGATYHGTIQLMIDPSFQNLRGMWLGFGKDFKINSGEWSLRREERQVTKSIQREYHEKL